MEKPVLIRTTMAAAMLLATAGLARADAPNVIEMRQTGMGLGSANLAGIRAVIAAKGDVKTLENPAKALQRWAAFIPSVFPKGTETGGNTRALPEIWSNSAGFQKAAAGLGEAAGVLMAAAKAGDAEAVAAAVKGVGDACGTCHGTYRAK